MTPTMTLRHVWREISDGNTEMKVLIVQQWWIKDSGSWVTPNRYVHHGEWRDVEVEDENDNY